MIIKSSASERPYFFLRIAEHCDKSKIDASLLVGLTPFNNLFNFSNSNLTEDNSIVLFYFLEDYIFFHYLNNCLYFYYKNLHQYHMILQYIGIFLMK